MIDNIEIKENIIEYIEQYLEIRDSRALRINVNKMIESFVTEFDFSDISMMIENIYIINIHY